MFGLLAPMTAKHSADEVPLDGVRTFLFTDIEGSTEKWEREPARMAQAVACHDELIRAAVEAHRGRVVKSTGDGVYAVFGDPLGGIGAAVDVQSELRDSAATAGIPLVVRCGLHSGEAEVRANDFFGRTLNRAARIMNAAYAGQVIVSRSVAEVVAGRLPKDISLRDLGALRLKGLAVPERVYQVIHPSLRDDFPPLRSMEATPNNIPQKLTSFIGRERELTELEGLLQSTRLLTLVGMGGLGKTRLSLAVGVQVMDSFDDGAWFADLASIREPSLVVSEVAKALGVREEPGRRLVESVCAHLKPRKTLLILDNCEQVIRAAAEVANVILAEAPDVRIIATSREPLRVPGEQIYPVLPLPMPERAEGIEVLSRSAAVRLFVERAQLHRHSFSLDEHNALQVAELVARLEGIPLALELAAARVRSLAVADINARLNDRYKLLTGGGPVLQERQQTLRALVDWSYDLLSEQERVALNRLSIFAGGFDLSAAEQICGVDPLPPEDIFDLLSSLVDKSLVTNEERVDGTRYRMLETLRDYGREKLQRAGESTVIAARHCEHYFAMAKAANRGLTGGQQQEWTRRMETELDNVRAAIALALAGGANPLIAVKIAVAMQSFWMFGGRVSEGRGCVRAMLALPEVQESDRAQAFALYVGAALATAQGDYAEARRMLERCLTLRRSLGNKVEVAAALSTLSWALVHTGDIEPAREREEEAMALFRQLRDRLGEAIAHQHLGQICIYAEDELRARHHVEQSLAIGGEIKHVEIQSECERMLGELALGDGDVAEASRRVACSLALCHYAGDKRGEATALWWLGRVDLIAANLARARIRLSGALRAFRAFEMRAEMLDCVEDYAAMARLDGAVDDAVRLWGAAASSRQRHGLVRKPIAERRWLDELAALRERLGDRVFHETWSQGQAWDINEAVRQILDRSSCNSRELPAAAATFFTTEGAACSGAARTSAS
jgi:predicted ATPase/class 3 adenylate cyclase